MDHQTFGARVEELRKARKIRSVSALAKAVGVSQPSMRAIILDETDPSDIKASTLMALAKVLRAPAETLWSGANVPTRPIAVAEEILWLAERIANLSVRDRQLLNSVFSTAAANDRVATAFGKPGDRP